MASQVEQDAKETLVSCALRFQELAQELRSAQEAYCEALSCEWADDVYVDYRNGDVYVTQNHVIFKVEDTAFVQATGLPAGAKDVVV